MFVDLPRLKKVVTLLLDGALGFLIVWRPTSLDHNTAPAFLIPYWYHF